MFQNQRSYMENRLVSFPLKINFLIIWVASAHNSEHQEQRVTVPSELASPPQDNRPGGMHITSRWSLLVTSEPPLLTVKRDVECVLHLGQLCGLYCLAAFSACVGCYK